MDFLQNKYFLIALTFGFYLGAQLLQRRTGIKLLNPILIAIAAMICFLLVCDIDYDTYKQGGDFIDFWLKPAVVALGVPLYKQLSSIKRQLLPLLLSELAGCIAGTVSVVLLAELFGATREVVISLAPKAVTTPIAMEISSAMGGIAPMDDPAHPGADDEALHSSGRKGAGTDQLDETGDHKAVPDPGRPGRGEVSTGGDVACRTLASG